MDTLLYAGLGNAVTATALALVVAAVARFCRRPALVHSLWLLVLLKLVTPPIVSVPLPWPLAWEPVAAQTEAPSPANTAEEDEVFLVSTLREQGNDPYALACASGSEQLGFA